MIKLVMCIMSFSSIIISIPLLCIDIIASSLSIISIHLHCVICFYCYLPTYPIRPTVAVVPCLCYRTASTSRIQQRGR